MVIGGSPIVTLQIIMTVSPLTVYTVDPTLTVMTPFSTEGGSDPPVSITMAIANTTAVSLLVYAYLTMHYFNLAKGGSRSISGRGGDLTPLINTVNVNIDYIHCSIRGLEWRGLSTNCLILDLPLLDDNCIILAICTLSVLSNLNRVAISFGIYNSYSFATLPLFMMSYYKDTQYE